MPPAQVEQPTPGPRLHSTNVSILSGSRPDFGSDIVELVASAARSTPNGTTQSSGSVSRELSAHVVYDSAGNMTYEVRDEEEVIASVPGEGSSIAVFTDLLPNIEPDFQSYPHELFGVWATQNEIGAFWSKSPEVPAVEFGVNSPVGTATYEGTAAGIHSINGATAQFIADVGMTADFDAHKVKGEVNRFRSLRGNPLTNLEITFQETSFSPRGEPLSGDTTGTIKGDGKWGARWSDGMGWTMGGTFGFAATDSSVSVLGAFTVFSGARTAE